MKAQTFRDGAALANRGAQLNKAEAIVLFNPSPEIDSLAEEISQLTRQGIPPELVGRLLGFVKRALELNSSEHESHLNVQLLFEDCARVAHGDTLHRGVRRSLTVKALAQTLRPALAVIAHPEQYEAMEFVRAVRTVDQVIATHPKAVLLTTTVSNELGAGRFELLSRLVAQKQATR